MEERRIAVEAARQKLERDKKAQEERVAAEERKREEDDRRRHEEEAKQKAETTAKKRFGEEETKAKPPTPATPTISLRHTTVEADEEEAPRTARRGPGAARPVPPPKPTRGGAEKRRGRLTLVTALSADEERERSVASFRRRTQRLKGHASNEPKEKLVREVTIPEAITIQELANRMSERAVDVIKLLMKQGQMAKITDMIDADTAQLIAEELGHSVRRVAESDVEEGLFDVADGSGDICCRARRSSPSWGMSTTARRRSLTRSARPMSSRRSRRHHPAHRRLPSDHASSARRSPSSIPPATRPSPRCARAAPR